MKVFISWSGARSKGLANALRGWLPMVLQYVEPWVSDKDIGAGDRWAQSIAGELEAANFGIICITPENLRSEWILFESGALSKSMLDAKVIPLLYGLELSDLSGPLSQFQAQKVEEGGIKEIVRSINKVAEEKTSGDIVDRLVPQLWPSLKTELESISDLEPAEKQMRPQHEILEELVTGVRGLNARMRDFDHELSERGGTSRHRRMRLHPTLFEDFVEVGSDPNEAPTVLLLIAGYCREYFPWVSELLVEAYREIRDGGPDAADRVFSRLQRSVASLSRGRFLMEATGGSKEAFYTMESLLMALEVTYHRFSERSVVKSKAIQSPDE